jgi:hypothetical protein
MRSELQNQHHFGEHKLEEKILASPPPKGYRPVIPALLFLLTAFSNLSAIAQYDRTFEYGPNDSYLRRGFDGLLAGPNSTDNLPAVEFDSIKNAQDVTAQRIHPLQGVIIGEAVDQATIDAIGNCPTIRAVDLRTDVSKLDLSPLAKLPVLVIFNVVGINTDDHLLSAINACSHLRFLYLESDVTARHLEKLHPLPELEQICLRIVSENAVRASGKLGTNFLLQAFADLNDEKALAALSQAKGLRSLETAAGTVSAAGVALVARCSQIEKLYVKGPWVEHVALLGTMSNLKELRLERY